MTILIAGKRGMPFVPRVHRGSDYGVLNVLAADGHQSVGKDSGETNHIERWFNTLRQRLARFVRKTLSFSKLGRFHEAVLCLFVHHYNQTGISQ